MENLEKILENLEKTGSNKEDKKKISEVLKNDLRKGKDVDSIMIDITSNIISETKSFFEKKIKMELII